MTVDVSRRGLVRAAAALGCALALAAAPVRAADSAEVLPAGTIAPAFEAVDANGQPFSLKEALQNGPVLLAFWSIFCGTCREELPILEQEKAKYPQVQFVTVNLDEAPRAKTVKGFAAQQGFTFRMLLNKIDSREFKIDQAYQIKATPALYLVNSDGTIAFGHYGAVNPEELAAILAKAK
jgi:thiol-disulfide isomerase/thioredoxin